MVSAACGRQPMQPAHAVPLDMVKLEEVHIADVELCPGGPSALPLANGAPGSEFAIGRNQAQP